MSKQNHSKFIHSFLKCKKHVCHTRYGTQGENFLFFLSSHNMKVADLLLFWTTNPKSIVFSMREHEIGTRSKFHWKLPAITKATSLISSLVFNKRRFPSNLMCYTLHSQTLSIINITSTSEQNVAQDGKRINK